MVNGIYLSCLTKKDGVMTEVCKCPLKMGKN
jgi:hypothetical protein